jgi:monovalent cation/hydrogen antiporter
MDLLILGAVIVVGLIVLTPLADRIRVPLPVLLTVFGLALPLFPKTPIPTVSPDLILPVVLPPLLFAATQRSTAREFRENLRPIAGLAVGLTIATAAAVAVVVHWAGLDWGPAFVLGAVVSPPDPVAATAVARRLRLPRGLVTLLEGEGMFNDATALVLYNVAIAAVVTGAVTAGELGIGLVAAIVGGVLVGLAAGALAKLALAALHDAAAETTVTVAAPFAAYLIADELGGSGVLAVLTLGLYLRSYGHPALTSGGWLLGRSVWEYADYVITSLVFILIGFELTAVLDELDITADLLRDTGIVVGTLVVLRFVWMYAATFVSRSAAGNPDSAVPHGRRQTFVVSWAGMRGVVTVATALAIPAVTDGGEAFPGRAEIVFVGLTCVLLTLVVQGMTLAPLVSILGVGSQAADEKDVAELRRRAIEAALESVRADTADSAEAERVRLAAAREFEGQLATQEAIAEAETDGIDADAFQKALAEVLARASEAERDFVLQARRSGEASPEVADRILTEVEARSVRLAG